MYGGVELDGAYEGDGLAGGEVLGNGVDEVGGVDADGDEDVEGGNLGDGDGDQAAMGVVDQEVAAKRSCRVVVDAAGAVGDVAHDQGGGAGAELGEDVGDGRGKEQQPLGELQGDGLGPGGANAVDAFVDLEAVVGREEGDCVVDVLVVQDVIRDGVQGAGSAAGLGDCV